MVAYKGSEKLKEIHIGSIKIKEIYKGSTLVYSSGGYPSGTILFENATAGTYTLQVDFDCTIHLDLVGGGGAGYMSSGIFPETAGSGAYISGDMALTAGTYTIVVGNGGIVSLHLPTDGNDSTFENNIAGGGKSGVTGTGGTATVVSQGLTGQNGLNDSTVGWINGYGAGGKGNKDGVAGYCKIVVV